MIRTDTTLKTIGLRIQELRYARAETQQSLAGKLQMLPPNYARIEQGRCNLTVDTLVRVANGLRVELAELFVASTLKAPTAGRPRRRRAAPVAAATALQEKP